jgi:hypothetical protein
MMGSSSLKTNWLAVRQKHIVRNALRVSLVVGSVLNLINQGSALLNGGPISWIQMLMNYLVPCCVASYSAAQNELNHRERS